MVKTPFLSVETRFFMIKSPSFMVNSPCFHNAFPYFPWLIPMFHAIFHGCPPHVFPQKIAQVTHGQAPLAAPQVQAQAPQLGLDFNGVFV